MKNRKEIIEFINRLESKYPVDQWKIEGVHIWPYIRIQIAFYFYHQSDNRENDYSRKPSSLSFKSRFATFLKSALGFFRFFNRSSAKNTVIFYSNDSHLQEVNGNYYNKYGELLFDFFESNKLAFINFHLRDPLNPKLKYRRNYILNPRSGFDFYLKLKKNSYKANLTFMKDYNLFLKEVSVFHTLGSLVDEKVLLPYFRKMRLMSDYFEQFLKRSKTKVVFVLCYYSFEAFALIAASRRLKIPSIDIQHGVQGNFHISYGGWSKLPEEGFNTLPNTFWNWDAYSSQCIEKWAEKNITHSAYTGGNTWLQYWNLNQVKILKDDISEYFNKEKINVILSLQPIGDPLPEILLEAIKKTEGKCYWWIRMHPRQLSERESISERIKSLKTTNFDIDRATELPLPAILNYMDIHVTRFSSVVLECINYNVPTIFTDETAKLYYQQQIPAEYFCFAGTVEEMLEEFERKKKGDSEICINDRDSFSKLESMLSTII